jgi:hypothetical protein
MFIHVPSVTREGRFEKQDTQLEIVTPTGRSRLPNRPQTRLLSWFACEIRVY